MGYLNNIWLAIRRKTPQTPTLLATDVTEKSPTSRIPKTRQSIPDQTYELQDFKKGVNLVTASFVRECIPLIRKLYKVNPDLGIALFDIIQLTNTGHEITFDKSVSDDDADKMRKHIRRVTKNWNYGTAGLDGIINKMIAQIYIGGALSNEWVPNRRLTGIESVILVNPEDIHFSLDRRKTTYTPFQRVKRNLVFQKDINTSFNLQKLNKNTYRYYGLFGDEDAPYGVPPFLTALEDIENQTFMKKNVRHIVQQVGLMGFLELLMDKPQQQANESEEAYIARLSSLLQQTKDNIGTGMIDGLMVGYQEDHEFKFHSTTKSMQGLSDVVSLVETQIANGLKTSGSFIGVQSGGTETMITIVFTKMLSQLTNVQNILSCNLEYGLSLELLMAGFKFEEVNVSFKPSTITDDLKIQQAQEIKIRNLQMMYNQGIISQEQYAHKLGEEKPDQKEPRVSNDPIIDASKKKEEREKDKDESDKRVRKKNKPQPKDK